MKGLFYALMFSGLYLHPFQVEAQATDNELWSGVSAHYKINKKHRFGLEQQFRFDDNLNAYKNSFTAASWRWKMSKRFALKTTYRLTYMPADKNRGRVSADLAYGWSKKKFPVRIKNRLRYQRRRTFNSNQRRTFLRNKLTFEYNASKLVDPFVAGEIFYRLDGRYEFRAWRINAGLNWNVHKSFDIRTYYQLEQEINTNANDRFNVFGLDLIWKIN